MQQSKSNKGRYLPTFDDVPISWCWQIKSSSKIYCFFITNKHIKIGYHSSYLPTGVSCQTRISLLNLSKQRLHLHGDKLNQQHLKCILWWARQEPNTEGLVHTQTDRHKKLMYFEKGINIRLCVCCLSTAHINCPLHGISSRIRRAIQKFPDFTITFGTGWVAAMCASENELAFPVINWCTFR